ncbi:MAG TPA: hypothetical protein PKA63_12110 [Oligoflexia bacterium]|nr:hypothetical protein [Oligoflexia bacterium]HMP49399.1 hypothetical protein [Oligoflexia bacterium]
MNKAISQNIKGASGILPLMFSTMGGVVFLLTFYNLTQFTAARSAADQAARRAARCLTTSDAEGNCRAALGNITRTEEARWFGYVPENGPGQVQVEMFNYSGSVAADRYGAQYNSYEVELGNPVLQYQEKRIRPTRFIGVLNSYARLFADIEASFERGGVVRRCVLRNHVQLPLGTNFIEATYYNNNWCPSTDPLYYRSAPGCDDLDATWRPTNVNDPTRLSFCHLQIPNRGDGGQPWLLLGGDPMCAGEGGAPPEPLTEQELINYYGGGGSPGDTNRPYPITGTRQYVVINVFSCDPASFRNRLSTEIRNHVDLRNYFTNFSSISLPGFESDDYQANSDPAFQNAFVYTGAPGGTSHISEYNWTYFEWHREAVGRRSLTRKVCDWMTYEEAATRYPEDFAPVGSADNPLLRRGYSSGAEFANLPEYTLVDAPSCYPATEETIQNTCTTTNISGQFDSFQSCGGWAPIKALKEGEYHRNVENILESNQNPRWANIAPLPNEGFSDLISESWAGMAALHWIPSWSNLTFQGQALVNQGAVRNRNQYNPKQLSEDSILTLYREVERVPDSVIQELLYQKVIMQEGIGAPDLRDIANPYSVYERINHEPVITEVQNVWPFMPTPQPRPYLNPELTRGAFDFNLNCNPTDSCWSGPSYGSLEEALRVMANSALPVNLTQKVGGSYKYAFQFQESPAGTFTMSFEDAVQRGFPACTQFRSQCGGPARRGALVDLGISTEIPVACTNGGMLDCYPQYVNSVPNQAFQREVNLNAARQIALGEVRRLLPTARFCEEENSNQATCLSVNIDEVGSEVLVDVQFVAPLTFPFNQIFNSNTLAVSSRKRELIETERLRVRSAIQDMGM